MLIHLFVNFTRTRSKCRVYDSFLQDLHYKMIFRHICVYLSDISHHLRFNHINLSVFVINLS